MIKERIPNDPNYQAWGVGMNEIDRNKSMTLIQHGDNSQLAKVHVPAEAAQLLYSPPVLCGRGTLAKQ